MIYKRFKEDPHTHAYTTPQHKNKKRTNKQNKKREREREEKNINKDTEGLAFRNLRWPT